ncbi:hypothetical protein D3C76_1060330 [compost metagenome]
MRGVQLLDQGAIGRGVVAGSPSLNKLGLGRIEHALIDLHTVQLLAPAQAAVGTVQDHAIVADGPALPGVREMHGGQQDVDRHRYLMHVTFAVAQQNMPVGTDHYLAFANVLHGGQGA